MWYHGGLWILKCENVGEPNGLFTHCFTQRKKKALAIARKCLIFCVWTSLGLNQGPPDYESVALTD